MSNKVGDWLDERTGFRALLTHALDEEIAGGARWAYVFGSALFTIFLCQIVTGLLLMATYTPAINGAWSSVYFIQHQVAGGWFVRGMHHYGAQAMIVVLGVHLMQVALYGAYKRPREVTWWIGLGLLGMVQGLALTGYLLPWDQKGYWATKVATNIAGTLPVLGPAIQTLIVGGTEYGQATLTRFFVLHVGVLPMSMLGLVALHLALFRKHGATPPAGADLSKRGIFFPDQLLRDVLFALAVVFVMATLTGKTHGAHLDAPADPTGDYPPRPEWYFLFLFQLLKYLPGSLELVGTVILPGLAGAFLAVLPLLDTSDSRRVRDRMRFLGPVFAGAFAVIALTTLALRADANDAPYQRALAQSKQRAERAVFLADKGIPPGGPLEMLRMDPLSRGPDLYTQHCTKCHVLNGQGEQDAPNHTGFGSREWILGMMLDPQGDHYFGKTKIDDMKPMGKKLGRDKMLAAAEFLFAEGREPQDPPIDPALAAKGQQIFKGVCMDCHLYKGEGADVLDGPDMTGYGSRSWIIEQLTNPDAESQYGDLNDMPAFADDLDANDMKMLAAYLRLERFKKPAHELGPIPAQPEAAPPDDDDDK